MDTPEFVQFHRAQQELNFLFWTTEICYAIVQSKVLPQLSESELGRSAFEVFADVTCHAFAPPDRPGKRAHYMAKVESLRDQVPVNLQEMSRWVIVRFHTYLENFLRQRLSPTAIAQGWSLDHVMGWSYPRLIGRLKSHVSFQVSDPMYIAGKAQISRALRNYLIHSEPMIGLAPTGEDGHQLFRDDMVREKLARLWVARKDDLCPSCKGACIPRDVVVRAVNTVLDEAAENERQSGTPRLFFCALFTLTNYRNFAKLLDGALPLPA